MTSAASSAPPFRAYSSFRSSSARPEIELHGDRAMVGGRPTSQILIRGVVSDLLERSRIHEVPGSVVKHEEIDRLSEVRVAFRLTIEGQAPKIETRRVAPDDPGLAPASVDVVFICDTGHHLPDRVRYYRRLREALRPGGRLVLIDFYKTKLPVGPPPERKISRRATEREAEAAGFRLVQSHLFLPYQYFLEFVPAG